MFKFELSCKDISKERLLSLLQELHDEIKGLPEDNGLKVYTDEYFLKMFNKERPIFYIEDVTTDYCGSLFPQRNSSSEVKELVEKILEQREAEYVSAVLKFFNLDPKNVEVQHTFCGDDTKSSGFKENCDGLFGFAFYEQAEKILEKLHQKWEWVDLRMNLNELKAIAQES